MNARILAHCTLLLLSASHTASAEWLAGPSRGLPLGDSASPDAPVISYAYGPRSAASVAADLAFVTSRGPEREFRFGGMALLAVANAESDSVVPSDVLRTAVELGGAWSFRDWQAALLGPGHTLELALGLGSRTAFANEGYVLRDAYRTDDVPFGAGGYYLGGDVALQSRVAEGWAVLSRVGVRAYTNFFPDLVGRGARSNDVANTLHEGAKWQTWFETGARMQLTPAIEPLLRFYVDIIAPHDDSAKTLWLGRLLAGAALPGSRWELVPYVASEAGHGSGLLVNRSELRLEVGVRLHAR